jgi:hypothetical protein
MIDRVHDLLITLQAREVGISRGAVYYRPRQVDECLGILEQRAEADGAPGAGEA